MGTNIHERHRAASGHVTPPPGREDDNTHALQSGRDGGTQRKSAQGGESPTRDAGRDDRRPGSETGKPDR